MSERPVILTLDGEWRGPLALDHWHHWYTAHSEPATTTTPNITTTLMSARVIRNSWHLLSEIKNHILAVIMFHIWKLYNSRSTKLSLC